MKKGKKLIVLFALANVLLFLLLFSSATWSWISVGTSSDVNVINSSHFNFDVTVKNSENVEIVASEDNFGYSFNLESSGTYTITIKLTEKSNAQNGYCKITAIKEGLTQTYNKNVVIQGVFQGESEEYLTFEIETTSDDVKLSFVPYLGIASTNTFEGNLKIEFNN
jgi:hypothetical protein